MVEVPRPERPAGGRPPAGLRSFPARRRARARRNARARVGATAALALLAAGGAVVATAGPAVAAASSPTTQTTVPKTQRPVTRPFSVSGVLVSVGKKSLAFRLADETVATATLTSSTVYTKTENLKPSALSNGKSVTVTGTTTNGVLAASRIVVTSSALRRGAGRFGPRGAGPGSRGSLPEGFRPRAGGEGFGEGFRPREGFAGAGNITFGTISGLAKGSFTLTEFNKDKLKVTTSSSTVVTETVRTNKNGLKVGQELFISGKEVNNTTVAAATVSQGNAGFGVFGRGAGGPGQVPPGGGATPPTT